MVNGTGGAKSERALETPGLADQLVEWLDIHAATTETSATPSIPFADWCCIPFVALIVIADMALQFWGK
jgi:hypothetical protein